MVQAILGAKDRSSFPLESPPGWSSQAWELFTKNPCQ